MKVSLSWLKEYVPIEMETSRLADALTMVGLEVEVISDRYEFLDRVYVGRIAEISSHPNSETLKCCRVDVGERMLTVVCGAPNIVQGQLVPTALPGTVFPNGGRLERAVIRGIASDGMLCSEAELGLGTDKSGVMVLNPSLSVGTGFTKATGLSDTVFEIGLTPNRPDCLSILGIAREVAAIQKSRIHYPDFCLPDGHKKISDLTSVTIQAPRLCPRYAARLIENVTVGPSPFWLQDRLLSVGFRPINNMVDITNFVMIEMGQPLHAFDFERLAGNRIVVRTAEEGETFLTLDQQKRQLDPEMLMICDAEKPVAIAGVMGGRNSEIEETSHRVLIESAYFTPTSIRRTSKKLGLSTDASHRFERGVDPKGTVAALDRAAQLMTEIGAGKLIDGVIDEYPGMIPDIKISLNVDDTNRLLGTRLDRDEIQGLLESIEFTSDRQDDDTLVVTPPSYRVDIERPVDLMEEVARLSGYQNIPITFPSIPTEAKKPLATLALRNKIKRLMIGYSFSETVNYSFISKDSCDRLQLESDDPCRAMLNILNPLTEDQAVMRTSLLPGLLDTMHRNIAQQIRNIKIFEVGKIFISKGQDYLPEEVEMLAALWTGGRQNPSWHSEETACDFYDIKGIAEGLLLGLGITGTQFTRISGSLNNYVSPGYAARIIAGDRQLGLVGELNPSVLQRFDLKQRTYIFELNLDTLFALLPGEKQFKPIPRFPAIHRDLTLIIDKGVEAAGLLKSIKNIDETLLEDLHLFAAYTGDPIPSGKKSISVRIRYRSTRETLEDETINKIHKTITDRIIEEFNATLPT